MTAADGPGGSAAEGAPATRDPLRGGSVRLTRLQEADAPAVAAWHADGAFLRLLDGEAAFPRSEAQLRAAWAEAPGRAFFFGVRTCQGDRLVGYLGLSGIVWNQGAAWIEMAVAPAEQGRGYGREALELALGFAFGELNLRRVQLTVFGDNARAVALYEKVGFRREGAFREFIHRDGTLQDMLLYGMLRREWRGPGAGPQPAG